VLRESLYVEMEAKSSDCKDQMIDIDISLEDLFLKDGHNDLRIAEIKCIDVMS